MKRSLDDLALFGGKPVFDLPKPVGQLNFPNWDRIESAFRGIFKRRYYTNHGPLAIELEKKLAEFFGVRHAICVTNGTIGLMIAAVALGLKGKVITPAFTFIATPQSLSWAGLEPVFCDVNALTHQISPTELSKLIDPSVTAILGVHLWGNPCEIHDLQELANQHGIKLYFDAAQAFGAEYQGQRIGGFGELEVISFHATKIVNSMEGGCVCTNNDELAARIRNIRSSYGSGPAVPIPFTGNGRFSEAQAAMALLSLEDFLENRERNRKYQSLYYDHLGRVNGISWPKRVEETTSNDQYVVLEIDSKTFGISRDELIQVLRSENIMSRSYFLPGAHRCVPFKQWYPEYTDSLPVTDSLCESVMQLPSGQKVSDEDVKKICNTLIFIQGHAHEIHDRLAIRMNSE